MDSLDKSCIDLQNEESHNTQDLISYDVNKLLSFYIPSQVPNFDTVDDWDIADDLVDALKPGFGTITRSRKSRQTIKGNFSGTPNTGGFYREDKVFDDLPLYNGTKAGNSEEYVISPFQESLLRGSKLKKLEPLHNQESTDKEDELKYFYYMIDSFIEKCQESVEVCNLLKIISGATLLSRLKKAIKQQTMAMESFKDSPEKVLDSLVNAISNNVSKINPDHLLYAESVNSANSFKSNKLKQLSKKLEDARIQAKNDLDYILGCTSNSKLGASPISLSEMYNNENSNNEFPVPTSDVVEPSAAPTVLGFNQNNPGIEASKLFSSLNSLAAKNDNFPYSFAKQLESSNFPPKSSNANGSENVSLKQFELQFPEKSNSSLLLSNKITQKSINCSSNLQPAIHSERPPFYGKSYYTKTSLADGKQYPVYPSAKQPYSSFGGEANVPYLFENNTVFPKSSGLDYSFDYSTDPNFGLEKSLSMNLLSNKAAFQKMPLMPSEKPVDFTASKFECPEPEANVSTKQIALPAFAPDGDKIVTIPNEYDHVWEFFDRNDQLRGLLPSSAMAFYWRNRDFLPTTKMRYSRETPFFQFEDLYPSQLHLTVPPFSTFPVVTVSGRVIQFSEIYANKSLRAAVIQRDLRSILGISNSIEGFDPVLPLNMVQYQYIGVDKAPLYQPVPRKPNRKPFLFERLANMQTELRVKEQDATKQQAQQSAQQASQQFNQQPPQLSQQTQQIQQAQVAQQVQQAQVAQQVQQAQVAQQVQQAQVAQQVQQAQVAQQVQQAQVAQQVQQAQVAQQIQLAQQVQQAKVARQMKAAHTVPESNSQQPIKSAKEPSVKPKSASKRSESANVKNIDFEARKEDCKSKTKAPQLDSSKRHSSAKTRNVWNVNPGTIEEDACNDFNFQEPINTLENRKAKTNFVKGNSVRKTFQEFCMERKPSWKKPIPLPESVLETSQESKSTKPSTKAKLTKDLPSDKDRKGSSASKPSIEDTTDQTKNVDSDLIHCFEDLLKTDKKSKLAMDSKSTTSQSVKGADLEAVKTDSFAAEKAESIKTQDTGTKVKKPATKKSASKQGQNNTKGSKPGAKSLSPEPLKNDLNAWVTVSRKKSAATSATEKPVKKPVVSQHVLAPQLKIISVATSGPEASTETIQSKKTGLSIKDRMEIKSLIQACNLSFDDDMIEFLGKFETTQSIVEFLKDSVYDVDNLNNFATEFIAILQNPFTTVTYAKTSSSSKVTSTVDVKKGSLLSDSDRKH